MKPFFCKTAIALSLTLPAAANAAEYVCNVEGITVYASYQINDACRIVETNNVTENSVVAIPGDTPVLKTVQTTEFKASAADYVHTSQATPAVQTQSLLLEMNTVFPHLFPFQWHKLDKLCLRIKPLQTA